MVKEGKFSHWEGLHLEEDKNSFYINNTKYTLTQVCVARDVEI